MKKLLLLSLLNTTLLQSQISLTKNDFANGGDTVRMSHSTDFSLDFTTTGPNQVWNFSTLQPSSQTVDNYRPTSQMSTLSSFLFGTFAPTPYKASYFIESANIPIAQITSILPVSITDIFEFSRVTVDSITSIGYSMVVNSTEVPFKSDTIEKRYDFPIDFGNTTSSRGYTNIDMNPVYDAIWRQYRTHTSVVDGWGSITTPYGTFDALRIKHEIHEIDSIYIGQFSIWLPLPLPVSYQYEWWTNGKKEPILRITTSSAASTENITAVEYRDIYRGLDAGLMELTNDFNVYPNPTTNNLKLNCNQTVERITISDVNGKTIREFNVSPAKEHELNTSNLESGFYFINIFTENDKYTKSFIKK